MLDGKRITLLWREVEWLPLPKNLLRHLIPPPSEKLQILLRLAELIREHVWDLIDYRIPATTTITYEEALRHLPREADRAVTPIPIDHPLEEAAVLLTRLPGNPRRRLRSALLEDEESERKPLTDRTRQNVKKPILQHKPPNTTITLIVNLPIKGSSKKQKTPCKQKLFPTTQGDRTTISVATVQVKVYGSTAKGTGEKGRPRSKDLVMDGKT